VLERLLEPDGLVGYRSPLLAAHAIPHLFTTRLGPEGAPLDLTTLDEPTAARLARAAGAERARPALVRQVHADGVLEVGDAPLPSAPPPAADALVTGTPNRLLVVRAADCLPVLLAARDGSRVAAVHAGWRGLVAGVLARAVGALDVPAPLAILGPCLSLERFEVGPEVARAFEDADLNDAVHPRPDARPHVDLRRAAAIQLARLGVRELESSDRCTWDHAAEFYSHRRDVTHGGAATTGRMAALVAVCRG